MRSLTDAITRMHMSSERAPDVRDVPMRLVRQDAFDEMLAAAEAHRAANEERVRSVVMETCCAMFDNYDRTGHDVARAIAANAAKQLATAAVGLSEEELDLLKRIRNESPPSYYGDQRRALLDRLLGTP